MIISYDRSLEENINEGIKTLEYNISSQHYPIVNEMLQLQIETLQWVQNKQKKEENSLESLKQIINFKVKRLEYALKKIARRDIEHTSKIVYQLEMLECCKIIINWELKRRTKTKTTKEDSISALC
jgi:histone acetyltransferase (RNA polymerase elongator complex component)